MVRAHRRAGEVVVVRCRVIEQGVGELGPVICVDDAPGCGSSGSQRHVQGVHDQVEAVLGVDGPADDLAATGIQDRRAIDLALREWGAQ